MEKDYNDSIHKWGRGWILGSMGIMLAYPLCVSLYYGAWPQVPALIKALLGIIPIFWTVAVIEVFTYSPMLGSGGTYLAFVTGNISNLKLPCALNAMENAKVKTGSEEGDIISTLAIATSSIVTTAIIALGVLLLSQITPIINSPVLKPAFDNILPSLFGGLAIVYIKENWKIALTPLIFMIMLFILVPSLASSVGILVPLGALISIGVAKLLYKRGRL